MRPGVRSLPFVLPVVLSVLTAIGAPAQKVSLEAGPGMFWRRVEQPAGAAALAIAPDGRVWAYHGWVSIFPPGRPDRPETLKAPSSEGNPRGFALDREGRACAWGWHARSLACFNGRQWLDIPLPDDYLHAAGIFDGRVFAAAQSLKRWDPRAKIWRDEKETRGSIFDRFHATPWGAFLAGGPELWALDRPEGAAWKPIWRGSGSSEEWVTSLGSAPDGRILVGTRNGFFVLNRKGGVLAHHLPGEWVTAVAPRPGGRYWASTWQAGLFFIEGPKAHRFGYAEGLPQDAVADMVLDAEGHLWFLCGGLQVARVEDAERAIRRPPSPRKMKGQVFENACAAAEALLGGKRASGQVVVETVEARTVVFLNGRQACPDRHQGTDAGFVAFRRSDGAMAVMMYNGYRFSNDCPPPCPPDQAREMQKRWAGYLLLPVEKGTGLRRVDLPAPDPVPAETPGADFLLDSKGRLWVGTRGDGLYRYDGSGWRRFAEEARLYPRNLIWQMAEDAEGSIWAASNPQFIKEKGYENPNLHRWRDGIWKHWSPNDGLGYWTAECVLPMKSGAVAVGTNGGLSILDERGLRTYKREEMTASHFVESLSEDAKGRLWITHLYWGNGATLFDGVQFNTLDSRDGLFADRLRASAHDGEGRVWLVADDGRVGVYDPALFEPVAEPVPAEKEPGK
jgi:streptogramin lyase